MSTGNSGVIMVISKKKSDVAQNRYNMSNTDVFCVISTKKLYIKIGKGLSFIFPKARATMANKGKYTKPLLYPSQALLPTLNEN